MPAGTRLTYGSLTLHSSEIVYFTYKRNFKITTLDTVAGLEITQPGNLSTTIFNIQAEIRDNASTKFTNWVQAVSNKSLEALSFLSRNWGNYYLAGLDITSSELSDTGDILRFQMEIELINNQNFG